MLAAAGLLVGGNLLVEGHAPMKDDVAWLIHVAQSWLDGGQPYVTEIEINPPPIIWFSALAVSVAQLLGSSVMIVYPVMTSLLIALIAWWVASLITRLGIIGSAGAVFILAIVVLLFVPTGEFGQREHLIACLALPWLAWRAGAKDGRAASRPEGFAAGLLVGICCAMKPTFLVPFLLVELVMWRRRRAIAWAGVAGAICAGAAMLLLSLFLHPAYLAQVVPLAIALYHAPFDLAVMVPRGALLLGGVLACTWALWWLRRAELRDGDLTVLLLVFATGAMVIYLSTGRGWFYQRIPATVATVLALCSLVALSPKRFGVRGAAAAMLVALAFQAGARYLPKVSVASGYAPALSYQIAEVVRAQGATRLMAFSSTLGMGFPIVDLTHTRWSSRFPSMWAVRSELAAEQAEGGAAASSVARRWVVEDFLTACPEIVVVDHADGVNYPEALSDFDPAFARAWSGYRRIAGPAGVEMFHRPPDAPPCSRAGHFVSGLERRS
ncbi:DUF2029 domain-containing protein [Plastoroseomonas arctica]|uniref:DUF2029 domain-containing protein n=1 Tax=Plastoroseomonas arctica TaxID=1509237 RepID=A0AAF1JZ75_9PROT|nr:DUF2029 domain-containing protein [Plastoroseomonas arctica]MBR0657544.1 DUF2029 domain-containing protein [Plastoroseomonas arctica]